MLPNGLKRCGCAAVIDEEKKLKHSRFAEEVEAAVTDPGKLEIKLRAENVDIAYAPMLQVWPLSEAPWHVQIGALPAASCCCDLSRRLIIKL